MAAEPHVTFQKFDERELATELSDLLTAHGIEHVVDVSSSFDPSFVNVQGTTEFSVKLRKRDFEKANDLLFQISTRQIENLDADYYLFSFSDEELYDIVAKPDEWNHLDYLLAQHLLKERGREVNSRQVENLRKKRVEELAKPEATREVWVMVGYVLAFLGGLIGIFIGWHLMTHKKTLPTGDRVLAYTTSDQKHGLCIFLIGIAFFIFWFVEFSIRVS